MLVAKRCRGIPGKNLCDACDYVKLGNAGSVDSAKCLKSSVPFSGPITEPPFCKPNRRTCHVSGLRAGLRFRSDTLRKVFSNQTIRRHQNSIFCTSLSWGDRCKTFRQLCRGRKQWSYVIAGDLRNESRLAGDLRVAVSPNDGETSPNTFEQQRKNVTGMRFALSE